MILLGYIMSYWASVVKWQKLVLNKPANRDRVKGASKGKEYVPLFLLFIAERFIHRAGAEAGQVEGDIGVAQLFQSGDNLFTQLLVEQFGKLARCDFNTGNFIVSPNTQWRKFGSGEKLLS